MPTVCAYWFFACTVWNVRQSERHHQKSTAAAVAAAAATKIAEIQMGRLNL